MKRRTFTADEINILRNNPYTFKVTTGQIHFTKEFKELFWLNYCSGMTPAQILRKYGYDPKIFGKDRVSGIQAHIKKEAEKDNGFRDGSSPALKRPSETNAEDPEEMIKQLQCEVKYLRQEVEFLKKISSIKNTGR